MSAEYWVDIISGIVDDVRQDDDLPSGLESDAPYYIHGHPLEIIEVLKEKDQNDTFKFKKYPLIALFQDFIESNNQNARIRSSTSLNIIIAMNTSPDYKSWERYNNVFKPVLYPIYDLLLKHIRLSGWFINVSPGIIPHDKIDRVFWGRSGLYGNEANIFNDHIDAIEIDNLSLDLRLKQICGS